MKLESIDSPAFRPYGKVVERYDFSEFLETLRQTPCPEDGVLYVPSDPKLEQLPVAEELANRFYGGMPIQIGYCNGYNAVLLVALEWEIRDGKLSTDRVMAFQVPAGTAVELYASTLHYAPCSPDPDSGFRASVVLPRGTNTDIPAIEPKTAEDQMLWARNKWLLSHPDAPEARDGAYVGLVGENLRLFHAIG